MSPRTRVPASLPAVPGERWLLLIHQLPAKPDYFRVKVWRRLQRIGAVAIKSSVYVLPFTDQAAEDFQWVWREVVAAGGEASPHLLLPAERPATAKPLAALRSSSFASLLRFQDPCVPCVPWLNVLMPQ